MWVPARASVAALLTSLAAVSLQTATAATSSGILSLTSRPLPMAVEGGRLAEVTAHAVPFPLGSSTLDGGIAAALGAILATAATDCFLFAQIVGHVQPGPTADGDTRAAHRLARARADVLAATLEKAGVPTGSVATTWDFGFTTPQPRATLWLFERTIGSDCQGTPLPAAESPVTVAAAPDASPPVTPAAVVAADRLEPTPEIRVLVSDMSASPPPGGTAPVAADLEPAPGIHLPAPETAAVLAPGHASALVGEASGPQPATASARIASAIPVAYAAGVAVLEPQAGPPLTASSRDGRTATAFSMIEVTFEPDSSFLSRAALAELEAWQSTLPGDAGVCRVEVVATVGDRAGRLQPERARLYNEWLAERRQSRVVDWLRAQSGCELRGISREFERQDESRRVSVRLSAETVAAPITEPALGDDKPAGALSRNLAPAASPASPAPHRA